MNYKLILNKLIQTSFLLLGVSMIFNHKEMFLVFMWNFFPVRVFALVFIILGLFVLITRFKKIIDVFAILYFSLFTFILISTVNSSNLADSMLFSTFYLFVFSLYICTKYVEKDFGVEKLKTYFLHGYLSLAVFSSLLVLLQMYFYFSKNVLFGAVWPLEDKLPRFGALFWDINHFALFIGIALWINIYLLIKSFHLVDKRQGGLLSYVFTFSRFHVSTSLLYHFITLSLLSTSFLFASSRSAFLGMLASIVVFLVIYLKSLKTISRNLISRIVLLSSIGIPAVFYIVPFKYLNIFRELFLYRMESLFAHFKILTIGFELFKQNPLLGVGANDFGTDLERFPNFEDFAFLDPSVFITKIPIHSTWFQFLVESGIFAFLSFLLVSIFSLYLLYKAYNKSEDLLYLILFAALFGTLVSGIFYSYNLEFYWLFFIFTNVFAYSYFKYDNKKFKKLLSVVFNLSFILKAMIAGYFIWFFRYLNSIPSVYEVSTFNSAKGFSDFQFTSFVDPYFLVLKKFQYIFGFFPYSGRLASLFFVLAAFIILYYAFKIIFKNKNSALFITLFFTSAFSYYFSILQINVSSYYFYISSVLVYLISYFLFKNKEIKLPRSETVHWFLAFTSFIFLGLSFMTPHFTSYMPKTSNLFNTFSQKYSLNDYSVVNEVGEGRDEIIKFYSEDDLRIYRSFDSVPKHRPYLIFTKRETVDIFYHTKISRGDLNLFVRFE